VTGHLTGDVLALLPPPPSTLPPRESGVVPVPAYSYTDMHANFSFATNLTRVEVIEVRRRWASCVCGYWHYCCCWCGDVYAR
jgi:hypothetical protein